MVTQKGEQNCPKYLWTRSRCHFWWQTHSHLAAAHYCSTVFARWHQRARPSSHNEPTLLTIPNGTTIGSAVFAWPVPHSPIRCPTSPLQKKHYPFPSGIWTSSNTRFLDQPDPPLTWHLDSVGRFSTEFTVVTNGHTDRPTDRTKTKQCGLKSEHNWRSYTQRQSVMFFKSQTS